MNQRIARVVGTGMVVAGLTFGAAACSDDDGDTVDTETTVNGVDDQLDDGADDLENDIDSGVDDLEDGVEDGVDDLEEGVDDLENEVDGETNDG